ncbi:MAG: hypothetical protein Aurels2KO_24730 [Aureliella sp.]
MSIARLFCSWIATSWIVVCSVVCAQEGSEDNPLRLDVVLDESLRDQPQVEVLGNFGGSLKVSSDGLMINQPPKSESLEASGLRLNVEPTGDFSLVLHLDVKSQPKSGSKVAGFFVALGSGASPRTAIGLVRGSRQPTGLATTSDFSKLVKKYFDIRDLDVETNAISIVKSGELITVSAGPDALVMEEVASFETTLAKIDVVDVIATAGTTSKPTGSYLLKHLSFVGDGYFSQPAPADYSFVWTLAKWLLLVAVLGIGVVVGFKYDLFRKKIF